jgi:hypothetical protein
LFVIENHKVLGEIITAMLMAPNFIVTFRRSFVLCFIWRCSCFMTPWKMSNDPFIVQLVFRIPLRERIGTFRKCFPQLFRLLIIIVPIMCQERVNIWLLITVLRLNYWLKCDTEFFTVLLLCCFVMMKKRLRAFMAS